jgi:hypothetical protein
MFKIIFHFRSNYSGAIARLGADAEKLAGAADKVGTFGQLGRTIDSGRLKGPLQTAKDLCDKAKADLTSLLAELKGEKNKKKNRERKALFIACLFYLFSSRCSRSGAPQGWC